MYILLYVFYFSVQILYMFALLHACVVWLYRCTVVKPNNDEHNDDNRRKSFSSSELHAFISAITSCTAKMQEFSS